MTPHRAYWMSYANAFGVAIDEMNDLLKAKRCDATQARRELWETPVASGDKGWIDGWRYGLDYMHRAMTQQGYLRGRAITEARYYWEHQLVPWVSSQLPPAQPQPIMHQSAVFQPSRPHTPKQPSQHRHHSSSSSGCLMVVLLPVRIFVALLEGVFGAASRGGAYGRHGAFSKPVKHRRRR